MTLSYSSRSQGDMALVWVFTACAWACEALSLSIRGLPEPGPLP